MKRMIIATGNLSDAATLTGTAASGALPMSNLKKMSPRQPYRAIGASGEIIIDLGAAKAFDTVALIAHSGSSRSSCRVTAAATQGGLAAPAYTSGLLPMRSHQTGYDAGWAATVPDENQFSLDKNLFMLFLATPITYRWIRIEFFDAGKTYIDIGRLYVCKAWQPATNMSYGLSERIVDPSLKARMKSGEVIPRERKKYRAVSFTLNYASEREMFGNVMPLEMRVGKTRDILFVVDPDEKDALQYRSYYGTMETLEPISNTTFQLYSKTFNIEEIPS